jgi:hypothetical protein
MSGVMAGAEPRTGNKSEKKKLSPEGAGMKNFVIIKY